MKKSLLFLSCAAILLSLAVMSCSNDNTPALEKAIKSQIMTDNPDITGLNLTNIKVEENITFGAELEHTCKIFKKKESLERGRAEKYEAERKPATAAHHLEMAQSSAAILEALQEYKARHASSLDSIVYYVVSFNVTYSNSGSRTPQKRQAAVTPDMQVCNIVDINHSVKLGMSSTMPGYKELLESLKAPEVEQEVEIASENSETAK